MPIFKTMLFTVSALLMQQAVALEYNQIDVSRSKIEFSYQQMGVKVQGHFKKFETKLKFDPNRLRAASVTVHVDLNSIDTGSAEGNEEAKGKVWFNSKAFPQATFVSSQIKALAPNKYEVRGKLMLKGHSQDLVVPIMLVNKGNMAVFEGSFLIKRADFAIGEGPWAAFDIVANEVPVKFHLLAGSAP